MVTTEELRSVPILHDVEQRTLQWLASVGEVAVYAKGERYFKVGDPVDHMLIVLSGRAEIRVPVEGTLRPFSTLLPGGVSGVLPYSRLREAGGEGIALVETRLFRLHRDHFREMEREHPGLVQKLVELMSDRIREGAQRQQQHEKLMALGKMSAGLAHELNNPAAAIRRAAVELTRQLEDVDREMLELHRCQINPDTLLKAFGIVHQAQAAARGEKLTLKQRAAREVALVEVLLDVLPDLADVVAPTLADAGVTAEAMQQVGAFLQGRELADFVEWLAATCEAQRLAQDIAEAAGRISELVASIKSYTHMDQAPDFAPVNVHEGLQSTLTLLGHRFKECRVTFKQLFDESLPNVNGVAGELNQVWTNLIANALDALPGDGSGELTITTSGGSPGFLNVTVADNGPGVPQEIQSRIFEPFFTTKGVGQGTGMGLDIVQRIIRQHNGSITLESRPGNTAFTVCLPLATRPT